MPPADNWAVGLLFGWRWDWGVAAFPVIVKSGTDQRCKKLQYNNCNPQIWRMSCLACLLILLVTVVIPLKLTYRSVHEKNQTKLWAIYWAIYTFFNGVFYVAQFLEEPPFRFLFVVFLVWLYHDTFKGALLINDAIAKLVGSKPALSKNLQLIAAKTKFLKVFEPELAEEKAKAE